MSGRTSSVVKLAVAAVAVAGVVGTAWAAPLAGLTASEATKVNMTAAYTVNQITEIEATGKNLADDDLRVNVIDLPTATKFGNLGTIRVRTNSKHWDVVMTTDNEGKMLDKSTAACTTEDDHDAWGNVNGSHQVCDDSKKEFLKSGPTKTDVVLDVAIGVAKTGYKLGNSAAPTTLYPMADVTSGPVFIAPVKVTSLAGTNVATGGISFAATIGGNYKTTITSGTFKNGIVGTTSTGDSTWTNIETKGFPTPYGNASPEKNEEFFYVNVGIAPATFDAINGNKNKRTYTETFYFELYASF
jgi:hypothetical protein